MSGLVAVGGGRRAIAVPAAFTEPRVSPLLWGFVRDAQRGAIDAVPDVVRVEARRVLPAYERAAAPAGVAVVAQWLVDVNSGMGAPLGDKQFQPRVRVVADSIADMPAALFTDATRREAVRTWEFFPGAAAIVALLGERGCELRAVVDALRRLLSAPAPPPPRQPPTPEELARADAGLARFRARVAGDDAPAAGCPAPRASLASDRELLARYEAIMAGPDANPAAEMRLASLRRKLRPAAAETPETRVSRPESLENQGEVRRETAVSQGGEMSFETPR